MLEPEPPSRSSKTGLDLVGDEQNVMAACQLANLLSVFRGHREEAAFALLRFKEDRGDVAAMLLDQRLDPRRAGDLSGTSHAECGARRRSAENSTVKLGQQRL